MYLLSCAEAETQQHVWLHALCEARAASNSTVGDRKFSARISVGRSEEQQCCGIQAARVHAGQESEAQKFAAGDRFGGRKRMFRRK